MKGKRITKSVVGILLILGMVAIAWWAAMRHLSFESVQSTTLEIRDWADDHVLLTSLVLLGIHGVGMFFTLPTKAVFNMVAGALLGFVPSVAITLLGTLLGTTGLFFVSKRFTPNQLTNKFPAKIQRFEEKLLRRPILTVASLRLILALPYGAITIFSAVTKIRYRSFLVGSFLGDLPVVCLYSAAGLQLAHLTSAKDALSPTSIIVLTIAGLGLMAGALWPGNTKKLVP